MFARILVFACLFVLPASALEMQSTPTSTWVSSSVSLEIREADGSTKKISNIPWALNLTVLDTMKMVDGIKFTAQWYKSYGDWLILSIDGTSSQGASGPNWIFSVNGSPACVGVGSYVLGPNAVVVWTYSPDFPKCP